MNVDIAGHVHALHFGTKKRIAQQVRLGHHARTNNILRMIDVIQEEVESLHPLHQPGRQARPFVGGQHPRNDVEGNQALRAGVVAVHVECDPHAAKDQVRLFAFAGEDSLVGVAQPFVDVAVRGAHRAGCAACGEVVQRAQAVHFIKEWW